jgi:beta-lactamase regulating signal transducer with metallopeptidase domain
MTSSLHAIAELVALRFIDSLVEGVLVCLLAATVLRLTPKNNAATRFAVWFSALIAIAALPWIGGALPHTGLASTAARHAAIVVPRSWALYFLAIWGMIALWFVLGVIRALWHLHVLRRNCIPLDTATLDPILRHTLERHSARRRTALCTSEQVRVPTAVGLFKPIILIPGWVMRELSPAELNQVLLHELAHFRRWDDWTNLAQQIMKAMFFFHPAVWWIDAKIATEREIACDDAVVAETRRPRAYAECLAYLAEKTFVRRSVGLAQAALGRMRQTSARIAQILDVNRTTSTSRSWGTAASIVGVLALGCGLLYSRAPGLVAFGSSNDSRETQTAKIATHVAAEAAIPHSVAVVEAKFGTHPRQRKLNANLPDRKLTIPERTPALQASRSTEGRNENLVHLTGTKVSTVPVTETFWVVVQSETIDPAAPPIYRIQMWRVTVLRTVISAPSRQISRSET